MKKGERLEKLILRSRFKNANQLSKASGVPYTTIKSFIERDLHKASIDNVVKIAKALNVSVEHLIGEDHETIETPTSLYTYLPTEISAGLPNDVGSITQPDKIKIADTIMGKYAGNKDIFITRINGDSMNKTMPHGSLIAVRPVSLENLKNSDIVVYSNEYEYSVKYFYHDEEHKRYVFRPHSNDRVFADDIYSYDNAENLQIHGKVVLYIVELD